MSMRNRTIAINLTLNLADGDVGMRDVRPMLRKRRKKKIIEDRFPQSGGSRDPIFRMNPVPVPG